MFHATRRTFLKSAAGAAFAPTLLSADGQAVGSTANQIPTPTPAQIRWQDAEVGLLYCFDLPIAASVFASNNSVQKRLDPNLYNPVKLDTDQWLETAKAAGAGYAVFTATHFNGFMQWQSDLYPYGLKQTQWRQGKGDVVGDFVESCRGADILPGIYFSTHRNAYQTVWGHYVDWGKGKGTEKQKAYNRIAEQQTEELCSRYGKLVQIWYDAGVKTPEQGGPDVLPVFEKHQPDSVFYHSAQRSDHRWIGNEAGHAGYPCWSTMPGPEQGGVGHNAAAWTRKCLHGGDPDGTYWSPGMVDIPLRGANGIHNWFWNPNQDRAVYTSDQLAQMYYTSVGRNCTLVIGVVIQPDGSIPEADVKALSAFGKEIRRRFGKPVAETHGEGSVIELALPAPRKIDHVVLKEDITHGERIREYVVETVAPSNRWEKLCEGQSVGNKRIHKLSPLEVARLRLRVTKERAVPRLSQLAVYSTS